MTECFRRKVIELFLDRKLIGQEMAENLLTWRHSGFSIDASIPITATDRKQREALAQYIARPPLSLKKIPFDEIGGKIAFHIDFNEYFKENVKLFSAPDFIAELTQHIPPRGLQYIRRYGLYSSRGRGVWDRKPYLLALAPQGWKHTPVEPPPQEKSSQSEVYPSERRSAWARLIAKVYEVDPLSCPSCASPMRVLAVITDQTEVKKILRHLLKIGRPPPGLDPASLN